MYDDQGDSIGEIEIDGALQVGEPLYITETESNAQNLHPSHLLLGGVFGWYAVPLKELEKDPLIGRKTPTKDAIFVATEGLYEEFNLALHSDQEKKGLHDHACATVSHPNPSRITDLFYPTVTGDIVAHATCMMAEERTTIWMLIPHDQNATPL